MSRIRQVVVTGGSSGIGRAVALRLARSGADVLIHCRQRLDAAEALAAEIRRGGQRSQAVAYDLAEEKNCLRLCQDAWQWAQDGVDVWVHCAGADVLTGAAGGLEFRAEVGMSVASGRRRLHSRLPRGGQIDAATSSAS